MLVWKDILNDEEMVSDSYPYKLVFDDAGLEIKAKNITKGAEDYGISNNEEEGEGGGAGADSEAKTVVNVVDAHLLNEINLSKKEWTLYIKGYLKKVKAKLIEMGKEERAAAFQAGATALTKFILSKYDEM